MAKKLSFSRRLQLLSAMLYNIQSFRSSIFILPKKIVRILEQQFNRFLWFGIHVVRAKAKVAWELVCVPIEEIEKVD